MEMKRFLFLALMPILFSCGNGEEGLRSTSTTYFIKNNSDYTIHIKEYKYGDSLLTYTIEKDSLYTFEHCTTNTTAYPYYLFLDSIRVSFSDTFTVLSTLPNEMIKFAMLENCRVENKSDCKYEVYYTITNADYEYAKQKLAEQKERRPPYTNALHTFCIFIPKNHIFYSFFAKNQL